MTRGTVMSETAMATARATTPIPVDQAIRRYRSADRPAAVDVSYGRSCRFRSHRAMVVVGRLLITAHREIRPVESHDGTLPEGRGRPERPGGGISPVPDLRSASARLPAAPDGRGRQ